MPREIVWKRPELYPLQSACVFGSERFSVTEGGTKSGKTVAAMCWLIEQAVERGPGYYPWVASVYSQSKIAWTRIKDGLPRYVVRKTLETPFPLIELVNGAVLRFGSADKPDSIYGEDSNAVVLDEASRCKIEAWEALYSTLTATQGPARIIGNVQGRGWFYKQCRKAESGDDPNWKYYKITWHEAVAAGVLSQKVIEAARKDLALHKFLELYECKVADEGSNPFGFAAIQKAIRGELSMLPVVAWGWDLAKSVDWTVGIGLDKLGQICRLERWQKDSAEDEQSEEDYWERTINRIAKITGKIPAYVDSTGLGDPILERLRSKSRTFKGFVFTEASRNRLVDGLAAALQHSEVFLYNGSQHGQQLVSEMESMMIIDQGGKTKYRVPDSEHDDCIFSLALAVAMLRKPKRRWGAV